MKGHLVKWDFERAFGFIAPDDGSENIFIHISDFKVKDCRPKVGDLIMYEVGKGKNGKKKAIRAYIQNIKPNHSVSSNRIIHSYNEKKSKRRRLFSSRRITLLISLVIILVIFGKFHFFDDSQNNVLSIPKHQERTEMTDDFDTFMKEQKKFREEHTKKTLKHKVSTEETDDFSSFMKQQERFREEHTTKTLSHHNNQTIYRCDGREYCSQMNSCEEAKYFIKHCPYTKMDGDGDGIPCENQWCGHLK